MLDENNVEEYILDRIKKVYIRFDDDIEVKLEHITEYDIDLEMQKYKPTSYSLTNRLIFYLSKNSLLSS
mgnify:CR=1 FL=1